MVYSRICCELSFVFMDFPPAVFVENRRKEKAPAISHRSYPIVSKVVALRLAAIAAIVKI